MEVGKAVVQARVALAAAAASWQAHQCPGLQRHASPAALKLQSLLCVMLLSAAHNTAPPSWLHKEA